MTIIQGLITIHDNSSSSDGLYVGDEALGEQMEGYKNSIVSMHFYISDREMSLDELKENLIAVYSGSVDIKREAQITETTGFLWMDDELKIGNHDIIDILSNYEGKYVLIEIEKNNQP